MDFSGLWCPSVQIHIIDDVCAGGQNNLYGVRDVFVARNSVIEVRKGE